ncbi:ATP-dependent DNA ligase [Paenibacillus sp. KN14-4R]|uniref:ATP-dependent DNA ligase n=1 Tax=Paenibacillus sp. KN14-4R TaxID=3445773 RepID=UPI003FA0BD31
MDLKPIIPFEPISSNISPVGDKWIAQIKWDGVRMLHYFDGNNTRLFNRKMHERTLQYPELLDTEAFCKAQSVILDGEIIAFDTNKPSFYEIMKRDSLKQTQKIKLSINKIPVTYMIFDILLYNGNWVINKSLEHRQKLLENIIVPRNNVQIVKNFSDGQILFNLMETHQMEGVIYKDLTSTYSTNAKDGRWRKQKIMIDLFAVVGGVTFRGQVVNSLLLGLFDEERFIYIGHAGTGKLKQKDWIGITNLAKELVIDKIPFVNEPERHKDAVWIKPELLVKVEFLEFTPRGTMRHPSIQAIVNVDKSECTVNQLK